MKQTMIRITALLPILALFILAVRTGGQQLPAGKKTGAKKSTTKTDPAVIAKLIEQLGSSSFRLRAKASQQLAALDEVPEALRRAVKNADPEIAKRAQIAVAIITARLEEKAFKAIVRRLHKVELDRFVRRMVTDKKFAGAKQWQFIQGVARAVTKEANRLTGRRFAVPDFDVKTMRRLLYNGETKNPRSVKGAVFLSTGPTPYISKLSNSLVIVDGDFRGATNITNSLVIVRGNVGHIERLINSIILATGNWEDGTVCRSCFVQVDNYKLRFTNLRGSVVVETTVKTAHDINNQILNSGKGPLQLLKFSPRKTDEQLVWGKEVSNLAVAITPADRKDHFLIRWKNTGKNALALPWARLYSHRFDKYRDYLLRHVFLKRPNGKLASACNYPPPWKGRPSYLRRAVVLGPGETFEETINLWRYVEKPKTAGRYQLSIELEIPNGQGAWDRQVTTWSGKIQSNVLNVAIGK